jgi:hypothetical protein
MAMHFECYTSSMNMDMLRTRTSSEAALGLIIDHVKGNRQSIPECICFLTSMRRSASKCGTRNHPVFPKAGCQASQDTDGLEHRVYGKQRHSFNDYLTGLLFGFFPSEHDEDIVHVSGRAAVRPTGDGSAELGHILGYRTLHRVKSTGLLSGRCSSLSVTYRRVLLHDLLENEHLVPYRT